MLLVCLDHGSNTLRAVQESGSFTVNYIALGHEHVALRFATKSERKFEGSAVWTGSAGGPILRDQVSAFAVCRVAQLVAAGDHTVVIGTVVDGAAEGSAPVLAYAGRKFFAAASE